MLDVLYIYIYVGIILCVGVMVIFLNMYDFFPKHFSHVFSSLSLFMDAQLLLYILRGRLSRDVHMKELWCFGETICKQNSPLSSNNNNNNIRNHKNQAAKINK